MVIHIAKRRLRWILLIGLILVMFHLCGGFLHLFAKDFNEDFDYPYSGNVKFLVDQMLNGAEFTPSNFYYFKYKSNLSHICNSSVKLLFLVKSDPEHYEQRNVIRWTWGSSKQLEGNVNIKTVFLIGERELGDDRLNTEFNTHNDILQGNFSDSYFNNTIKTMMGLKWAFEFCSKSTDYIMFVDDDYFVSAKNVLEFVKNPYIYPGRDKTVEKYSFLDLSPDKFELYAGYVFESSPFRSYFSKWYVSLREYPYNKWPPYVTAGAFVLSRLSLIRMYYASLFMDHFRFDDIYIGILAYKLRIEPVHNTNFHFYKLPYTPTGYHKLIATHGYSSPDELWGVWKQYKNNEQI
ncbi:beta-1,3-galactosyltransferase brn-like [Coccinella septempunctata]|uniref:beta-1,3-galactosyltransferase brn-like n=1 Tax=Coccinella septempunctata TaxID=41139 RepID=UPI001D06D2DE|nr:beta-1,3-galactosyltransferase brn-like [Coccinella septempunctata]XP_044759996.1 beta-1,3-galactosyltransferase brn-like [Coccinella septempunctata]